VLGAEPTADAPVLDEDLQRVAAPDGPDRAADHAQRVATRAAGGRHQVAIESQTVTHQAGDAVVRISTGAHAAVAPRAPLEVEEEQVLRLHQALSKEGAEGKRRRPLVARADLGPAGGGHGVA